MSLSIIRLANYSITTYIQKRTIEDVWDFSDIASIVPGRDFSSGTLTEVWLCHGKLNWIEVKTLPWKTKSDRSISIIEDKISELLHHCYKSVL